METEELYFRIQVYEIPRRRWVRLARGKADYLNHPMLFLQPAMDGSQASESTETVGSILSQRHNHR